MGRPKITTQTFFLRWTADFFHHRDLKFAITMNQQGGTNANLGGGGGYIPAPRQDMEYICAGTIQNPSSQGAVLFLNTKTVERRMRSSRESRYVVESAVIALCTRRERNEVRFSIPWIIY
jgi:hypothetical protein